MAVTESGPTIDDPEKKKGGDSAEMTFRVVGVGASAGGLEAVSEFLSGLPATTGMAYLLVQHLDPNHGSALAEVLAKRTPMPVAEAQDGMAVEPNRLYIIPPNASLTLPGGCLRLTPRQASPPTHMPINMLFQSLAEERRHNAVGVVLSGSGSDGTRGLQAIKEAGGVTFAEEPANAGFPAMPRSAIEAGCVDFTMPPPAIAEALVKLGARADRTTGEAQASEDLAPSDEFQLQRIFRLLNKACGINFTHYKRSTLKRRLARRMTVHSIAELGVYVDLLEDNDTELQALCQGFLVRVTGFFRDPETFKVLTDTVFPALVAERSPKEPLRIWVPGCASGEEVYSIAMCLVEFLGIQATHIPIQIFGTDLSDLDIDKARAGRYAEHIAGEVSGERLRRFFVQDDEHYRISHSLRDLCMFARQNITSDPPFSRLNLVSCRNLLIYFDRVLQRQVIPQFHYALKPGGFLLLGPSESIGDSGDLFEVADRQHKIYRRPAATTRVLSVFEAGPPRSRGCPRKRRGRRRRS